MSYTSPEQAQAAFYQAFQHADIDAMMAVWADDERIVCVHPAGERLVGVEAVRRSWREIFSPGPQLRFELADVRAEKLDAVAVYSLYERISVSGEVGVTHLILATNVYVRDDRGWRMLMHHASPVAARDTRPSAPSGTVH